MYSLSDFLTHEVTIYLVDGIVEGTHTLVTFIATSFWTLYLTFTIGC